MKPLLVVNPRAGGGKTGKTFGGMRQTIERALGAFDAEETLQVGHAIAIARDAARAGRPLVVALGGDGTLNEVVNGLMQAGEHSTRLGLIAQGTGGDFRRTLGLEHRLDRYLDAIASGNERTLDVGKLSYTAHDGSPATRYFVNILSAGMGGLVDQYVAQGSRALGGTAAYFSASARALLKCQRGRLKCTMALEGKTVTERVEAYMIAVCNGRYFGSGMHVAPMAKLDDGCFEVVAMDAPSKLAFAVASRKIYDGAHMSAKTTRHFRCSSLEMTLENSEARDVFLLDVDGEPLGKLPVRVEVVPRAITLRA